MDNLTHTLAGAVLGEAGLKRRTRLAMPTLLIGANLPDIDVVALLFSSGLAYRRGWTHGVLALVVLPILLTLLILAWDRWRRRRTGSIEAPVLPREILLLSGIAVLSHPFLDWLNNYGMRWMMPFDGRWSYGDALFIVDPWVWLVLLAGTVAARRTRWRAAGSAAAATAGLYIAFMLGVSATGRSFVEATLREEGRRADRLMVGPVPVDPTRRQVIVREGDEYRTGNYRLLPARALEMRSTVVRSNLDHPLFAQLLTERDAADFMRWARFPFFVVEERADRIVYWVDDLRYSDGTTPSWAAVRREIEPPETNVVLGPY